MQEVERYRRPRLLPASSAVLGRQKPLSFLHTGGNGGGFRCGSSEPLDRNYPTASATFAHIGCSIGATGPKTRFRGETVFLGRQSVRIEADSLLVQRGCRKGAAYCRPYTATSPMPSTCMTRSATVSTVTMATVAQMRMRVTGLLL